VVDDTSEYMREREAAAKEAARTLLAREVAPETHSTNQQVISRSRGVPQGEVVRRPAAVEAEAQPPVHSANQKVGSRSTGALQPEVVRRPAAVEAEAEFASPRTSRMPDSRSSQNSDKLLSGADPERKHGKVFTPTKPHQARNKGVQTQDSAAPSAPPSAHANELAAEEPQWWNFCSMMNLGATTGTAQKSLY